MTITTWYSEGWDPPEPRTDTRRLHEYTRERTWFEFGQSLDMRSTSRIRTDIIFEDSKFRKVPSDVDQACGREPHGNLFIFEKRPPAVRAIL